MRADAVIAYICVGFCTLPSDFDRAMREASVGRTATDTDSHAFPYPHLTANEGMTAALRKSMKQTTLKLTLLVALLLASLSASAYDCCVDGIYYNLNKTAKTASVTFS